MPSESPSIIRGQGCYLWDQADKRYIDTNTAVSGIAMGHSHPAVREAIIRQSSQGLGNFDGWQPPLVLKLQDQLRQLTHMPGGVFSHHQMLAVEFAIKMARLYGKYHRAIDNPQILVFEGARHGDTLATIAASHQRRLQAGIEPLLPGFVRAPYNDIDLLETIANNREDIVAVLIEPIQIHNGVKVAETDFLIALQQQCQAHQWLMMLDESHTGMGRTGPVFYHQSIDGLSPDLLVVGNDLANGIPIGYCALSASMNDFSQTLQYPVNQQCSPIALAAASAVLETAEEEGLFEHTHRLAKRFMNEMILALCDFPVVKQIRGRGLMLAVAHDDDCLHLKARLQAQGLLVDCFEKQAITITPSVIIDDSQIEDITTTVREVYQSQFGMI